MRDVLGGDRFQEAAPHDESAEGGAGDGGAEGGGVSPGDCPPRHCHALPHLSHSEVSKLLTNSALQQSRTLHGVIAESVAHIKEVT